MIDPRLYDAPRNPLRFDSTAYTGPAELVSPVGLPKSIITQILISQIGSATDGNKALTLLPSWDDLRCINNLAIEACCHFDAHACWEQDEV